MNRRTALAFTAFVAVVIFTNWITAELGFVTWLGVAATAGTWFAGFAFVARDYLQESGGKRWVVAAILLGAVISAWFSPALAVASGVAFLVSELADFAVYTPLRKRGKTRAAIASNVVGSVVDSVLFLYLAGFPLSGTPTQVLVKVGTTTVFVLGVRLAVSRQSLRTEGGGRNA